MSEEENVYLQMGRLIRQKNADKEELQEMNQLQMRKLAEYERSKIQAMNDHLSTSEPILNRMSETENHLLALENTAINSTTPFLDSFRELRVYLDRKFVNLDRKFDELDRKVDQKFAQLNLQLVQLKNINLNKDGEDVMPVPFLDGTWPEQHNLPEIKTVSDIDALTRNQCREYLTGYGIFFRENETVNLKRKVRDVIGFSLGKELKYSFNGFDTQ